MKIIIKENKESYKCTKAEINFLKSISDEKTRGYVFREMYMETYKQGNIIDKDKGIKERLQIGL